MKIPKKLGIWMDHSIAHVIELQYHSIRSFTIESLSLQGEKQNFGQDESLKHNTEQDQLSEFFKRLSTVIIGYPEVLLFGPTNAKTELYNLLKEDSHFNNIQFKIETTDKLTENQMRAYVKEHYSSSKEAIT
jgi:hypothetical protein